MPSFSYGKGQKDGNAVFPFPLMSLYSLMSAVKLLPCILKCLLSVYDLKEIGFSKWNTGTKFMCSFTVFLKAIIALYVKWKYPECDSYWIKIMLQFTFD